MNVQIINPKTHITKAIQWKKRRDERPKELSLSYGEQVVASCATTLEQLILAKHAPKPIKATYLISADAYAELTALKLRAILELKLANETNVLKIQAKLSEARRQIGGWRKSVS